ncbi:sperm flagellar protein 2 isoform X1 [Astyanax mexicanus]|uniref:sperm flagellar protein 2 isoform X1 n=1 Tax=Astyanax mexicanus TaxID=7994 RepID=UPI0020CAF7C4|nr:sperm flagellar protein 2 isoform X1 [Astyanax mexicanus]
MSDILCRWLNLELGLSKVVEPHSFSKDFSSGYLLGEILSRYQLQDDFQHFTKNGTASAKLNNFTRLEPSLQLLGVAFDLGVAKSVMRGQPGAATRLLYQLYVLLQKKKRSGLTGTAMETMQPTATTRLHRIENHIYNQRLRGVVKREVDERMQKITQRFDRRAQEGFGRSVMLELQQEEKRRHLQEERRLQDIQKLQQVRRKQQEMMECIQTAAVQIPKPPVSRSLRAPRKRQQHEAQSVHQQIAQFEKNRKRLSPASCGPAALSVQVTRAVSEDEMAQWNSDYVQKIRQRLEEDANAREQREKRRRRALIQQLHTHHTHEEMIREEQLIGRLMRQSQQEKRMAVQLMQIRQQKEVLRQNRILQQRQFEEQRLADLQQILDQEAMVLEQTRLERQEELCKERELHARLAAERAQSKHQKHLNICRGILDQIVDLATKSAEYRLLTANVIPGKMLREWKELYFSGEPLYDGVKVEQEVEVEKQNILNQQDYSEYTNMTGEWAWPEEEGEIKAPPPNNDILGHVVARLQDIVNPPGPGDPPPLFPSFTLRACVLGKLCSGKTSCLTRISQVHGIHILSAEVLIQEALEAHQAGELDPERDPNSESQEKKESSGSEEQVEEGAELPAAADSEPAANDPQPAEPLKQHSNTKRSLRAQYGAEVEKVLKRGGAVSDELLIDILIHAIRQVPEGQGWVLDGFPISVSQARLLEKALSGTDPDQADRKRRNKRPNLAKDRNAPKAPPPPSPALHLAVLLQVSEEQVVDRAVRRSPEQVREENAAPAEDTQQRAPPAGEHTLIQHRIAEFQEAWPKLEKWFGEKQRILVKVSAELDEDSLFSSVESVLYNAINTTQKESLGHNDTEDNPSVQSAESGGAAGHTSVAVEEACSPTPGSVGWVYADEPLPKEIPEFLVGYWETVCSSYDSSVKVVMQNLRSERNLIIHHLYNTREDYKQFLQRPDLKQECVCVWQRDFNSVPDNMRHDEETKTELHQRLDDLRECLWDICDKRKEEAEQKRAGVMEDGWLEDHTGLLINHYSTLLQVEVDRFQDTLNVLRDYYTGMYRTALPEAAEFTCIPLLDITDNDTQPNGTTAGPSPGSAPLEKHTRSAGKKEAEPEEKKNENKKTRVVPLVEYRSPPTDPSVLLQDIHHTALTAITNMASVEVQRLECEANEEQHITTDKAQTHTEGSAARRSATKKSAKKKSPPTPVKQPTPPPAAPVEESPEEVQRRAVRSRIRLEYSTALQHEECAVRQRMELVKLHALKTVQSIQHRAERTHTDLQEWLNHRFTSEINSIDRLAEVVKFHIEGGLKITHELVLESTDFFIDGETRMLPTPPPQPRPPPLERTNDSTLTVLQLHGLLAQLHRIAPAGLVSSKELCEFLQELTSLTMGSDALPEPWTNITDSQLQELVCMLVQDSGMVNWRQFLLSAAQPWPRPSQKQLLKTLRRFREMDTEARGVLTLQQYTQVELWFSGGRDVSVPDDTAEPLSYDRLTHLKQFFFMLFSDPDPTPPVLDYLTMLLYFCCHPDPAHGFTRALSLLTQHHLQHTHTGTSTLLKSVLYMDGGEECEAEEEDDGVYDEGDSVSLDELLRVLNHGRTLTTSHHNKHTNNTEDMKQDLIKVFKDLGFDPEEKVPFSILSQHLFLQDLMESSNQYLLADIHTVLQLQKSEEEPSVFTS